jgi:hypothetical protein
MRKVLLKQVVRYSILTSLALDTVGTALGSGYTLKDKQKWYTTARSVFPTNRRDKRLTGTGSYNSRVFTEMWNLLTEFEPTSAEGVLSFVDTLVAYVESRPNTFIKRGEDDSNNGYLIPMGLAIGYYSAVKQLDVSIVLMLLDSVFACFDDCLAEVEANTLIGYWIYRLCHTGYFGYHSIEEATDLNILGKLRPYIDFLMATHPEVTRLKKMDSKLLADLSYSYKLLGYVVFYMLRVDTACSTGEVKSLPREQLLGILNIDGIKEEDAVFLYGAICTTSEHKHPLIPKPLRESVPFFKHIDFTLEAL